ncbi:MAG: hypothetical protein ACRD0P_14630 [Stackebrandtia sp.]
MTSDNTSKYEYLVTYAHQSGHGCSQVTTDEPITSYGRVIEIQKAIAESNHLDLVITGFQLLSGPQTLQVPGLYSQVNDAIDAAKQRLDSGIDAQHIAVTLLNTLIQVRDVLAADLPANTNS